MFAPHVYLQRRQALMQRLASAGSGLVLLPGHDDSPMNYPDNAYPFRQDSSFLYYAGLAQPGLALLLDLQQGEATLFADDADLDHQVWTGPLPSAAERAASAGIERHAPRDALAGRLQAARAAGRPVHLLPPYRGQTRLALARWLDVTDAALDTAVSGPLVQAVVAQRALKAPEEIAEMEDALALTREMHLLALRASRPGVVEQEVVGAMEALALARGRRMAYPSIFSSRGQILHNHDHGVRLQGGEIVVNDSGSESAEGYASDITRVIPVGGRFEGLRAEAYELVLSAQEQAIAAIRPGVPYREVHLLACRVLAQGMKELGFLRGDVDEAVAAGAHALFMPHGVGHMIGLDVHDMESLGEDHVGYGEGFARDPRFGFKSLRLARPLRAGWVVTVEPGLYINPLLTQRWQAEHRHEAFIDYAMFERHAGLGGIRIEDDVLVTAEGARVLGPAIPKARAQVEALASA
ncbi:MAG: aminopeptidase P family protein [Pseudomonadota bacterium]